MTDTPQPPPASKIYPVIFNALHLLPRNQKQMEWLIIHHEADTDQERELLIQERYTALWMILCTKLREHRLTTTLHLPIELFFVFRHDWMSDSYLLYTNEQLYYLGKQVFHDLGYSLTDLSYEMDLNPCMYITRNHISRYNMELHIDQLLRTCHRYEAFQNDYVKNILSQDPWYIHHRNQEMKIIHLVLRMLCLWYAGCYRLYDPVNIEKAADSFMTLTTEYNKLESMYFHGSQNMEWKEYKQLALLLKHSAVIEIGLLRVERSIPSNAVIIYRWLSIIQNWKLTEIAKKMIAEENTLHPTEKESQEQLLKSYSTVIASATPSPIDNYKLFQPCKENQHLKDLDPTYLLL